MAEEKKTPEDEITYTQKQINNINDALDALEDTQNKSLTIDQVLQKIEPLKEILSGKTAAAESLRKLLVQQASFLIALYMMIIQQVED